MNVYLLPVCLVPHVMMTLMDITAHAQMDIQEYIVKQVNKSWQVKILFERAVFNRSQRKLNE